MLGRRRSSSKFKLFSGGALGDHLRRQDTSMSVDVDATTEEYILGADQEQFAEHLADKYRVENIDIDFDAATMERRERTVPAEHFPPGLFVRRGQTYLKPSFVYFFPLTGDPDLLRYQPSPGVLWSHEAFEEDGCLCVEFVCFHDTTNEVQREKNEFVRHLGVQLGHIQTQVDAWNSGLRQRAAGLIATRRTSVLKKRGLEASLGVPIRKRDDTPQTFVVPSAKRRARITPKPVVAGPGFTPEPTIGMEDYREILRTIYEFGKQLERTPSVYKGKDEEVLRDHLLLVLEPNFTWSATGESLNGQGKTDILLRHEGSNLFIAECKWWSGQKGFTAAIDQLRSYLTWRDSKAALVIFVERKDMSAVVETARQAFSDHPACLGTSQDGGETWLNFKMHLVEDRNRVAHVAVLLFHLP